MENHLISLERQVCRLRRISTIGGKQRLRKLYKPDRLTKFDLRSPVVDEGMLISPRPSVALRARRKARHRPRATRKPPCLSIGQPGEVVQIDTKDLCPERGLLLKHFSARDMASCWDVVKVHERAVRWQPAISGTPLSIAFRSPSPPSKSMAAASSPPSSSGLDKSGRSRCSFRCPARRNSTGTSSVRIARIAKSSIM
jgi:hypothetical protein